MKMKGTKGAVTVFLIIVLFTTVLMGGLFIDATRVLLAKRYIRNTLNSSARSALSYYDANLSSEYGMFAVNEDAAKTQFTRYFKNNIALSQNDGFDILGMEVKDENIHVNLSGPLLDNNVMQGEMKEYTKYRVVVNTAVGVVEKLKGLFGSSTPTEDAMDAASAGKSGAEALKKDAEQFAKDAKNLLTDGINTQKDAIKNDLSVLLEDRTDPLTDEELGLDKIQDEITKAQQKNNGIGESREEYDRINNEQIAKMNGAGGLSSAEYYDEDTGDQKQDDPDYVAGDDGLDHSDVDAKAPGKQAENIQGEIQGEINATQARFNDAKGKIKEKSNQVIAINQSIAAYKASISGYEATITACESDLDTLKEQKRQQSLNQLRNFVGLGTGDEDDEERAEQLKTDYDNAVAELDRATSEGASPGELHSKREAVDAAVRAWEDFLEEKNIKEHLDEEIERVETTKQQAEDAKSAAEDAIDAEERRRDQLKADIDRELDKIPSNDRGEKKIDLQDAVSDAHKTSAENMKNDDSSFVANLVKVFDRLKSLGNELGKVDDKVEPQFAEAFEFSLDDITSNALGTIGDLIDTGKGLITLCTDPEQALEAVQFSDYVFGNFTFLTTQTQRSNRHFQIAELEYIMNHDNGQAKCLMKSVSDVFLLRLAINWADYLIHTQSPEIVSRMLIALGRALIQSVRDMGEMIFTFDSDESASCQLCPSFKKIRLTYSDHLRLLLMLRSINPDSRSKLVDRVQKMMEITYEVQDWGDMSKLYTQIEADVSVDVDLIMLTMPMFEKVLPPDNQILQDGKFLVHESVKMGY